MYRNVAARVSLVASAACVPVGGRHDARGRDRRRADADGGLRDAARKVGAAAGLPAGRAGRAEAQPRDPQRGDAEEGPGAARSTADPVAQKHFGLSQPEPLIQFEGASDDDNAAVTGCRIVPPDTEGDVGPSHYVQYINDIAAIYDKSGNIVLGPVRRERLLGRASAVPARSRTTATRSSDTTARPIAGSFSQFALPNFPDGPFYQCFAVSTTSDPTGDYYQYEFKTSDDFFTDYGKIGVWPDAYYMSFNMFGPNGEFQGGAYAFDRAAMLAGAPAGMIIFDTGRQVGVLPSDLDGPTPPPAGSPELLHDLRHQPGAPAPVAVPRRLDDARPTARSPARSRSRWPSSSIRSATRPRGQCVPQLDSPEKLETLEERLMYRLVYRNFGDHESLVVNHTVGTEHGKRRRSAGTRSAARAPRPSIYQQGTYAPDASFRWMGSIAMDGNGNIALGYSKSSATMYPSIAVTGRLAGDPLGTMGAEDVWFAGGGSQVDSSSRWGDYSTMSIDPVDDCTFWYTQEYYAETSELRLQDARSARSGFRAARAAPPGALEGTVTDGSSPLAGATVTATPAGAHRRAGDSTTTTDASGHYQFLTLPVGTLRRHRLEVRLRRRRRRPASSVTAGRDHGAGLRPRRSAATVLVVGTVKDGSGQGWPLYAKLVVSGPSGFPGATLFTRSGDGLLLDRASSGGGAYDFAVTPSRPGYVPGGGPVWPGRPRHRAPPAAVANWTLAVAPTCTAPGYGAGAFVGPPVLSEGFDAGTLPAGLVGGHASGVSWKVYTGVDPCCQFDGNRTGGSGPYAIVNSGCSAARARTTRRS